MVPILLPGPAMRRIFEYHSEHQGPLLRAQRDSDVHSLRALGRGNAEFELVLSNADEDWFYSIEEWTDVGEYYGMPLRELLDHLRERGYQYELPNLDEVDPYFGGLDLDQVRYLMKDLEKRPTIGDVLAGTWGGFKPDPDTPDPGLPTHFPEAWTLKHRDGIDGPRKSDLGRPGWVGESYYISSPIGLSCLQAALDQLQRKTHVWVG